MYSKKFEEIANEIENLRLQIYQDSNINIYNIDDKLGLDTMLFSMQSRLRYEVKEMLEYYEDGE